MSKTIRRELLIPQPREQVWRALTDSAALAEWRFPNDFEPRVGRQFTFQVAASRDGIFACQFSAAESRSRHRLFPWRQTMNNESELERRTVHVFDYDPETGEVPVRELHVVGEPEPQTGPFSILSIDLGPALRRLDQLNVQQEEPAEGPSTSST